MTDETYQQLQSAFQYVNFETEVDDSFRTLWKERSFPKNSFLTEAGRLERNFYFVVEGITMGYLINKKGEKAIYGFAYTNEFSGIYDSFIQQEPSKYFLEAVTSCKVIYIPYNIYEQLFEDYPSFNIWERQFLRYIFIGRANREIEITTMTAKERYQRFVKRCPEVLLQVPQKYLATYLNMTPETYSRLRADYKT